jgi:hypothetical protein
MSSTLDDHRRDLSERWYRFMQDGVFDARSLPPHTPRAEDRMVAAMEFTAFQLGEINQRLAQLIELTNDLRRR